MPLPELTAQANRAAMPEVSAFVAAMRISFPDCRVRYAAEGGRGLGKPGPVGVIATQVPIPKKREVRRRA